ncbi:MAG: ferric reductase-like transmembrane domain-containing protein [Acidimicrobiia bacterium]
MSAEWLLIRGSGLVAFGLLSASVIWGLLVSSKLLGRLVKAKPLTWFHESLGISALVATVIHMIALSMHDYVPFSWTEILIPGRSNWRPLAVALGVMSFYTLLVVAGSFYVKRFIGQKAWRAIHFASFGLFVSALLHGMLSGTDTGNPWVLGLYLGSAVVVFALLAHRLTPVPTDEEAVVSRVSV